MVMMRVKWEQEQRRVRRVKPVGRSVLCCRLRHKGGGHHPTPNLATSEPHTTHTPPALSSNVSSLVAHVDVELIG